MWNLWRVEGRDRTTGEARAIGYLVTSGRRFPDPIAFVPFVGAIGLRRAVSIRNDHSKAGRHGFQRADWRKRFDRLLGMLLIPISAAGAAITNDSRYGAAQFMGSYHLEGGAEFQLFSHRFLQSFRRCRFANVEPADDGCPLLTKRSGASDTPDAAKLAGSSEERRVQTAA